MTRPLRLLARGDSDNTLFVDFHIYYKQYYRHYFPGSLLIQKLTMADEKPDTAKNEPEEPAAAADVVSELFAEVEVLIGEQTETVREEKDKVSFKLATEDEEVKNQEEVLSRTVKLS